MAKTAKPKPITIDHPATLRRKVGINQSRFWSRLGVTQSGGSRYETGRPMPKPVRMLMALAEGKATIEQLKSGDLAGLI